MTTDSKTIRVGNMSDMQLNVKIVGVNGDTNTVILQPKAATWLPPGYKPQSAIKNLYVFPDETTQVAEPVVETPAKGAAK